MLLFFKAGAKIIPLNEQHMKKVTYDRDGHICIKPYDEVLQKDIDEGLRLNGLFKNGKFISDTTTELVKGRKDTYKQYERFVKKLDKNKKCTSSQIKKKINAIQAAERKPEFAGVLLYFLEKKYNSLQKQGL